eukprot:TRINITY_DN13967_c0_g4_i2.p1 TRINITY_DN13967_c0_g4~~TRINITY_DN13967_c0_g4_i2.p1  ORF type:complete len:701 (-),score=124.34 TRINITY_DN13967_c0_g4_i2:450-2552(-)
MFFNFQEITISRLLISVFFFFFFQAEDGIRDAQESRGLGDVYKRQVQGFAMAAAVSPAPSRKLLGSLLNPQDPFKLRSCGGVSKHNPCPWLSAPYACKTSGGENEVVFVGGSDNKVYAVSVEGGNAKVLDSATMNAPIYARPSASTGCGQLLVGDASGEVRNYSIAELVAGTPKAVLVQDGAVSLSGGVSAPITLQDRSTCVTSSCGKHSPLQHRKPATLNPSTRPVVYVTANDFVGGYVFTTLDSVHSQLDLYTCGTTTAFDCDAIGQGVQGAFDRYGDYVSVGTESGFQLLLSATPSPWCRDSNNCMRSCPDPQPPKEISREGQAWGDQPLEAVGAVYGSVIIEAFGDGGSTDEAPSPPAGYLRSFQSSGYSVGCNSTTVAQAQNCSDASDLRAHKFGIVSFGFPISSGSGAPQCQQYDAWASDLGSLSHASPSRVDTAAGTSLIVLGGEDKKVRFIPLDAHGMPKNKASCCPLAGGQPWRQHDPQQGGQDAKVWLCDDCSQKTSYSTDGEVRTTAAFGPPTSMYADTAFVVSYDGVLHGIRLDEPSAGTMKCTGKMKGHSLADPFIGDWTKGGSTYHVITTDMAGWLYVWDQDCKLVASLLVNDPGAFQGSWIALVVTVPLALAFLAVVAMCCVAHEPWKGAKQMDLEGNRVTQVSLSHVLGPSAIEHQAIEHQALLANDSESQRGQMVSVPHAREF